jgi:hypothetical protein
MPTVAWAGSTTSKVTNTVVKVGRIVHDGFNYKKKGATDEKSDKELLKKD